MTVNHQADNKLPHDNDVQIDDISKYPKWAQNYFANLEYSRTHIAPPPTKHAIKMAKWAKKHRIS
ncbi:MAG: hypothetical protein QM537_01535 [Candidatus Symbiobacter sp.]|nr:hypothetical protein [Candidatus Symbiobacter sp.]